MQLHTAWLLLQKQISELNQLKIPRQVLVFETTNYQIHGFCDASQHAYGAAVYIRSENSHGEITVNLLCAKSRVAPLKMITIPKLELSGALILAQLVQKVSLSYPTEASNIFYWTQRFVLHGLHQNLAH